MTPRWVAIVGQQSRSALGGHYQQEIDLVSMFKDVASDYVQMVASAPQLRHVVDSAFRIALSRRCPTCIILPTDVQELEAKQPPREHGTVHSGVGYSAPRVVPSREDLDRAAEVLNAGERVAMLVGAGAQHATQEVLQVSELLGAGIAKALLGKPVVADDIAHVTGAIGLLGTKPTWQMMSECDTLLMVGSSFPYSEFLPEEGHARGVQIDLDARTLGLAKTRHPLAAACCSAPSIRYSSARSRSSWSGWERIKCSTTPCRSACCSPSSPTRTSSSAV